VFSTHTFNGGVETNKTTVVSETLDFNIDLSTIVDASGKMIFNVVCRSCGMDLKSVDKTGKLGCPCCYTVFGKQVKILLRKLDKRVGEIKNNR